MRQSWFLPLELALRAVAGGCVVMAVLRGLGPSGASLLGLGSVPESQRLLGSPALSAWAAPPSSPVDVVDADESGPLVDPVVDRIVASSDLGVAPVGYADAYFPVHLQHLELPRSQRTTFLALNLATWLVLAVVWWWLAKVVSSSRLRSPFTGANARRLTMVGGVLLAVSLLRSWAQHSVQRWMVDTSTLADTVDAVPYGIFQLPWGAMAVGAGVLAVAFVWRRGVAMADDLEGLV